MIIATHWTLIIWVEIKTLQVLQQAKKAPDAWSQHETTHTKKTTKKRSFRVSWWRFLGRGGVKTPLETPASEANLDLLESPIPLRQDHSQTIWSIIVLSLMIMTSYHGSKWSSSGKTMAWPWSNKPLSTIYVQWHKFDHGRPETTLPRLGLCEPCMIMETMAMYNIEKAATANNSITWLKIFKVNKTQWYNMIDHV